MAIDSSRKARSIKPFNDIAIAAIRWEIYSSLQNLLDSLAMIVVELGLVKPSTYGEIGTILHKNGVLSEADAELVKKAAATRNLIAHAYRIIEKEDLLQIATNLLPKVEELSKALMNYIKESNLDPENDCLQEYIKAFEKNRVKLAYLFGSIARGTSRKDSDYDFAVLFNRSSTLEDEVKLMLDLAEKLNVPVEKVDVVALDRADNELKYRVLREGKLVYASDEKIKKNWERSTLIKALESRDIYEIYMKGIKTLKRHNSKRN